MTIIIGFAGRMGAGKDTAAAALTGFENVKLAGALKAMLAALLRYQGASESTINSMLEGALKEIPSALLGGRTPRFAMQTLGTEWGRDTMASDLWIDAASRRLSQFDRVAFTDVRFPNEVAMIKARGGKVYRIERPTNCNEASDNHVSEAHIDALEVDGAIFNQGPRSYFVDNVRQIFGALLPTAPRRCDIPPPGWECSREVGHDGPCAASPVSVYGRE